jgi:hypothetical protein
LQELKVSQDFADHWFQGSVTFLGQIDEQSLRDFAVALPVVVKPENPLQHPYRLLLGTQLAGFGDSQQSMDT